MATLVIRAAAVLALAGGFGTLTFWGLQRPRALTWRRAAPSPPPPAAAAAGDPRQLLLQAPWLRGGMWGLAAASAGLLALVTWALTGNLLATLAFGWMGWLVPDVVVSHLARRRWVALDQALYTLAYNARFYLAQGLPVGDVWRQLLPTAPARARRWLTPCLTADSAGMPFETSLKRQALAIRHPEAAVLADVLATARREGPVDRALAQLLALWGRRLTLDTARRGQLKAMNLFGELTLGAGMILFWVLTVGDAGVRAALHTPVGGIVGGLSAGLLAVGVTVFQRQTRLAEAV